MREPQLLKRKKKSGNNMLTQKGRTVPGKKNRITELKLIGDFNEIGAE